MNKLGLTTLPNPKPYPLGWVHGNAKVQVTKQYIVRFVIASKLIDEADLDVVPLHVCELYLGVLIFMIEKLSSSDMRTNTI